MAVSGAYDAAAGMNRDGRVTLLDALMILRVAGHRVDRVKNHGLQTYNTWEGVGYPKMTRICDLHCMENGRYKQHKGAI